MTVSPFDHPLLAGLLGDGEVAAWFSVAAELGIIPTTAGAAIAAALDGFAPDTAALRAATARDGVVVPELVRQIRHAVGEPHARHVHLGATSQDVIDTALMLRLKSVLAIFERRLDAIVAGFADLESRFGSRQVTAVTRMQPAIAIPVGNRIETWRLPLERHRERLREQSPRVFGDADRDVVYVPLPEGHELWWYVGFRSRELRDRFDVALAQIRADGTYRRIRQRYGLQ